MIAYCPGRGDVDGRGGAIAVNAPSWKVSRLLLLVAGVGIILSSTAAIAHIMEWFPAPAVGSDEIRALDESSPAIAPGPSARAAGRSRSKSNCSGCGVIVSIREVGNNDTAASKPAGLFANIQARPGKSYEFSIRLRDGSSRVITDANPAAWRVGERVHVIDSVNLPRK
jgi:hypothetical protein